MNLKLKNPLAFFDLETTGLNIANDRIVEIAVLKIMPNGEQTKYVEKINPTIPISIESSLIHGIYEADIKDKPTFKQIAKNLAKMLEGADLGGFNIIRFDVPLLVEEFLRAGVEFDISKRKFIDSQRIYHLMEPRNLSAAYKFYCKKDLKDAHTAEADTIASFEVLDAQIAAYENVAIEDKSGKEYVPIHNDMKVLHDLTASTSVDFATRMVYNDKGIAVFNFGKYKDQAVLDILKKDPSYYDWMMKGDFSLNTKQKLTEIKLSQFNVK